MINLKSQTLNHKIDKIQYLGYPKDRKSFKKLNNMKIVIVIFTVLYTFFSIFFIEKFVYKKQPTIYKKLKLVDKYKARMDEVHESLLENRNLVKYSLVMLSGIFLLYMPISIALSSSVNIETFLLFFVVINSSELICYGIVKMFLKRIFFIYLIYGIYSISVIYIILNLQNNLNNNITMLYFCFLTAVLMYKSVK